MILEARNLSKNFGSKTVLSNINFRLNPSEFVTVLGVNGAGKSTLISLLAGLRKPSKGQIRIEGYDPRTLWAKKLFSISPQDCDFPKTAKGKDILKFVLSHNTQPVSMDELISTFDLGNLMSLKAGAMSGGQKRRLSLACAFGLRPKVVFLDEPTAGLDIESRKKLWSFLQNFKTNGGSIILTTHHLEEAEFLSDRVVALKSGEVHFDGSVLDLKNKFSKNVVTFESSNIQPFGFWKANWKTEGWFHMVVTPLSDRFVSELLSHSNEIKNLRVVPASLEDCFLSLIRE